MRLFHWEGGTHDNFRRRGTRIHLVYFYPSSKKNRISLPSPRPPESKRCTPAEGAKNPSMRRQVVIRVNPCTVVSQQGRDKVHTVAELAHRSRSAAAGRAQLFAKRGRIGRVQTLADLVSIRNASGCVCALDSGNTRQYFDSGIS